MTSYTPKGVCSRQINIEVNGDTIESVQFVVASGLKIVILLVLLVGRFFGSADFRLQNIDCLFDCRRVGDTH